MNGRSWRPYSPRSAQPFRVRMNQRHMRQWRPEKIPVPRVQQGNVKRSRKARPAFADLADLRLPLVSILTPSLNQARFLGDCLASVDAQTYRPIEHIVCDGGSLDGSVDLLRRGPDHVRWTSERDRGQAHAVNKAYRLSAGDIIGWLNSDDAYADTRAVEWAVAAFRDHPRADVVFGSALLINERNRVLQAWGALPFRPRMLRAANYLMQPAVFIHRRVLPGARILREDLDYVFDRALWFDLAPDAHFHRLGAFLGLDRHQRERKLRDAAYEAELAAFNRTVGTSASDAVLRVLIRAFLRLAPFPQLLRIERELQPAVALDLPQLRNLVSQQLFLRRRRMPFA
jgi:glycosyltransferase involved in cell wall biosynthesis